MVESEPDKEFWPDDPFTAPLLLPALPPALPLAPPAPPAANAELEGWASHKAVAKIAVKVKYFFIICSLKNHFLG
jgi:hypothetical protein